MPERKQITYSREFKEEAVRLYLEGEEGYKKLTKRLGLTSASRLRDWVAKPGAVGLLQTGEEKAVVLAKEDAPAQYLTRWKRSWLMWKRSVIT